MAHCSRCGRKTHVEYGSDGLPYCSSCIFYGLNKPCFRCRMYLPVSELQQYKGQWMCPYCLMDSRDEDRRMERGPAEHHLREYATHEKCERCGRTLSIVYYFGGRRLCETCIDEAKREWGEVGGERPPLPMYRITQKKAREAGLLSFLESLFSELIGRVTGKEKKGEIVAIRKKRKTFVPFARPMKEEAIMEKQAPLVETVKKKGKKKKGRKKEEEKKVDEEGKKEKKKKDGKKEKEDKKEKFGKFKGD